MATKGKAKKVSMSPEEKALKDKIDAFVKAHPSPSDAQKETLAKMRAEFGGLKFVRIANKRIPRVIAGIRGIKNLSGRAYTKTKEQVDAICTALEQEVAAMRAALSGEKKSDVGFQLPLASSEEKK